MGQGFRTALATLLSSKLGLPADRLTLTIGDTDAAPQHVTAGSWGMASAIPAAAQAADELLAGLQRLSPGGAPGRTPDHILRDAGRPFLEVEVRRVPPGMPDAALTRMRSGVVTLAGAEYPGYVSLSYIDHFVQVRG